MPTYNGETFDSTDYKKKSVLSYLYYKYSLSMADLADIFSVSKGTIQHWMKKHDIERR